MLCAAARETSCSPSKRKGKARTQGLAGRGGFEGRSNDQMRWLCVWNVRLCGRRVWGHL